MDIWALVPVKSLLESKRRLSHLLSTEQRAELIRGLLQHELDVLSQVPAIDEVLIISSDPTIWEIARQNGALVEAEQASCGLNSAVARGMELAGKHGAAAVLILPVDLPFIAASDVDLMIKSGLDKETQDQNSAQTSSLQSSNGTVSGWEPGCTIAICSDEDGNGTNAIFISTAKNFSFHFGPGSFQRHVEEAQERGMMVRIVSTSGLEFDLDNEHDWYTYQASMVGC